MPERKVEVLKRMHSSEQLEHDYYGNFLEWGVDYAEMRGTVAVYTVAIVEFQDGTIRLVFPDCLRFLAEGEI
jgi:hypothetical protein